MRRKKRPPLPDDQYVPSDGSYVPYGYRPSWDIHAECTGCHDTLGDNLAPVNYNGKWYHFACLPPS